MPENRSATLYRMVLPDHTCPFGVRAKLLLLENGFEVDDRVLQSREEVEALKEYSIDTTPLIFIGDAQVGGSDDLERFLAKG